MNKVDVEPVTRTVDFDPVVRSVELEPIHIESDFYRLTPVFQIDQPKERDG